jgi:hypothetical protein
MPTATAKKNNDTADTIEPETYDSFEILHELIEARPREGGTPPIFVDIARVPGHGLVARATMGFPPNLFIRLWTWDAELRKLGRELAHTPDGAGIMQAQIARFAKPTTMFWSYVAPSIEDEIRRFSQAWPAIAPLLKLNEVLPQPRFPHGHIQTPKATDYHVDWPKYVKLHVEGDWGRNGQLDETHVFTPAERFILPMLPIGLQNLDAIKLSRGCVRSQHDAMAGSRKIEIHGLTVFPEDRALPVKSIFWPEAD